MSVHTFPASTTFVIAKEVLASELGSEFVILNLADGIYYGLDEVGGEIWKLLSTPVTLTDICGVITSSFDVEPKRCREDVVRLLDSLASRGLVDVRTPA
jgi:hypothetical protein